MGNKNLYNDIESLIIKLGLDRESGALIYSSLKTLYPSNIYFLGINPGGVLNQSSTILDHFRFMRQNPDFNEYSDWVWSPGGNTMPKSESILQKRIQYLLSSLAINTRYVFGSNLIFKRSKLEQEIKQNFKIWAEKCWSLHEKFLSIVDPSVIIILGNNGFEFLRKKMINNSELSYFKTDHGQGWMCKHLTGDILDKKRNIIMIPHLSRFAINNISNRPIIDWIKSILN